MKIQYICPKCHDKFSEEQTFYAPIEEDNVDCCPNCSDGTEPNTWVPLMVHWIEDDENSVL